MDDYKHLHPSMMEHIAKPDSERISWINEPIWIGYPRAKELLNKLDDLLRYPRQSRMPNMLIVGRSNNGKTRLIQQFTSRNLASDNPGGDNILAPVLCIQAPPSPSEAGLYTNILTTLYERVPSASTEAKRTRVIEVLRGIETKVLVIDELHNMLAGSSTKQQNFLNVVKYIGNELNLSIVGCGTGDLIRAISIDDQIENRFTPEILPLWKVNKEYRQLLASFESVLPLKKSSVLHDKLLAQKIHALSEGTIGELSMLLCAAAKEAIRTGQEKITSSLLDSCGYTPPSDRKAIASRI